MADKLIAAEVVYLDPADCGSTLGYKLITTTSYSGGKNIPSFYAEIDLTDCTRKINWSFNNRPDSIVKINKAITMLTNFKKEFVKAQKKYPKAPNDSNEDY